MVSVKRFKQIKMIRDKHCTNKKENFQRACSRALEKVTIKSSNLETKYKEMSADSSMRATPPLIKEGSSKREQGPKVVSV